MRARIGDAQLSENVALGVASPRRAVQYTVFEWSRPVFERLFGLAELICEELEQPPIGNAREQPPHELLDMLSPSERDRIPTRYGITAENTFETCVPLRSMT